GFPAARRPGRGLGLAAAAAAAAAAEGRVCRRREETRGGGGHGDCGARPGRGHEHARQEADHDRHAEHVREPQLRPLAGGHPGRRPVPGGGPVPLQRRRRGQR
ncbi:unnamed protein product, partial [Scytosiphon promiscuus]